MKGRPVRDALFVLVEGQRFCRAAEGEGFIFKGV